MNTEFNKLVLVTGGAGGLGSAISRELAKAGYLVGIHYNNSDLSAKKLQETIKGSFLIKANLSEISELDRISDIILEMGGIDLLVNNAGITADGPLLRQKIEDFDRVISLNMRALWYLTKKLSRSMIKRGGGKIINISSVVGLTGNYGQSIYGMSKAAIDNFTKSAALEFADYNILVNSIAPGFIDTAMTESLSEEVKNKILEKIPLKRLGTPEDVAVMVRFLATEANYSTGNIFHVNGGMYGGH